MQMHMDQWNQNNNYQFQRNQYGGMNQQYGQPPSQQQYQPTSYTQQTNTMMQYPHSTNQSAQNISRPNYMMKDDRKGNLALTGELALGKHNNYQQMNGGRLNYTGNMNFDSSNYEVDPYRNRGNTTNNYQMNNNMQQQPYMKIQQQQQQQIGGGAKNISPNDIAQAQSSLRLLKQKMQNKETTNYSKQDMSSNYGDLSSTNEKVNSQSTTNTSLNPNKQFRKVFKVGEQDNDVDTLQKFKNQKSDEFADNEFAPPPRQRGSQQRAQQQNNYNPPQQDNVGGAERNQINRNNTNLNGSLKRDNSSNLQLQYQSSMQRTMEKKDPQMMYNAQRYNQMQNYEYQGNNNDDEEDFVFASNSKKGVGAKKPPIQKQQPDYGYQSSSINTINNKKQFNSPNQFDSKSQQSQQPPKAGSYRGEVNGQKYYNFSKNLDSASNDNDNEYENAANQKFMSKPNLKSYQSNQKFNSRTVGDEDDQYGGRNQQNNQESKNNRLNQLNKNNAVKQKNDTIEAPIIPKVKINEPSKYDLSNIDEGQAIVQDAGDLEECPEGCGRRFAPESLEKHAKICKKVFQKKRQKFDMQKQRIKDEEHEQILEQAKMEEKRRNQYQNKNKQVKQSVNSNAQQDKKSKWRIQSEQFRAVLKANQTGETVESQPQYDDRVECPHCRRKFNEQTYNKHEPICGNRARIAKASGKPFKK